MDVDAIHRSLYPYAERFGVIRSFPEHGRDRAEVLAELRGIAEAEDARWATGRSSGTVYHGGAEHYAFLTECFGLFGHVNALQRDLCPSMSRFESEILAMTLDLLHADAATEHQPGTRPCGVLTSGGTESILTAVLAYRELARERGVTDPTMIVPDTAHPAFAKAAHLFGLQLLTAPTDPITTKVEPDAVRALIDGRTALLVGSAGNYPYGTIDPIAELSDLAVETGVPLHVDGCLGGWILPWGQDLGYPGIDVFDYRLPGVSSISADPHKYGYALKGVSVLTWRDTALRRRHYFVAPDWKGGLYASPSMAGSRSGGLIASTWAAMVHLGREGYRERARQLFDVAFALQDVVRARPQLRLLGVPTFCLAFTTTAESGLQIYHVNDELARRGWRLNGQQHPDALHLAVTGPQLREGLVEQFATDLDAALAHAATPGLGRPRSGAVYGIGGDDAPGLPLQDLPGEVLQVLVGMFLDAVTDGPPSAMGRSVD